MRARLWALHHGVPVPALPAAALVSVPAASAGLAGRVRRHGRLGGSRADPAAAGYRRENRRGTRLPVPPRAGRAAVGAGVALRGQAGYGAGGAAPAGLPGAAGRGVASGPVRTSGTGDADAVAPAPAAGRGITGAGAGRPADHSPPWRRCGGEAHDSGHRRPGLAAAGQVAVVRQGHARAHRLRRPGGAGVDPDQPPADRQAARETAGGGRADHPGAWFGAGAASRQPRRRGAARLRRRGCCMSMSVQRASNRMSGRVPGRMPVRACHAGGQARGCRPGDVSDVSAPSCVPVDSSSYRAP